MLSTRSPRLAIAGSWARGRAQSSGSSGSLLEMPEGLSATCAAACFECWQRTYGERMRSGRTSTDLLAEVELPTASSATLEIESWRKQRLSLSDVD